ncbi:MAG: hypothetical protein K8T26_20135 [Lentisphaerae bacterium]|nr:hypothetical protein [Lentisphaerota bacterium]
MNTKQQAALDLATAHLQHTVERIDAQLAFARALCERHPAKRRTWQPLIDRAAQQVQRAIATGSLDATRRAVAQAEATLAPLAQAAKAYTIHCVGHAHIDMNWMWSWPETVAVVVDTVGTILRLMTEYPEFRFSQSQASIYAILEQYRPDLLAQVAARVREGRWEVTASHWVECEKNLAGAESLCRHLLYTRRYLHKLFGLTAEDVPIDWAPDTFGHPASVPTYLARGGVTYLYLHRPGDQLKEKHWMFWWVGPDGSRVLVRNDSRARAGYNGAITPDMLREMLAFTHETSLHDAMFVYGVGDHGGGPTRRDLEQILEMNRWPIFPAIRFSTARAYFDTVAPQAKALPVVTGELNVEVTGCYTTQSLIKKANRHGENRLLDAETAASLVWLAADGPYPFARFEQAWRNVLFTHFHDILPGSGIMDTRTHAHGLYQETVANASQAETESLRLLASRIDTTATAPATAPATPPSRLRSSIGAGVGMGTQDGGFSNADRTAGQGDVPLMIFNPTTHDRDEVVEAAIWDNGPAGTPPLKGRAFSVRLPDGTRLPAQVLGGGAYWGHDHALIAFPARVPGLGYAMYTVSEDDPEQPASHAPNARARQLGKPHHCAYLITERSAEGLENEWIRVDLDPTTGGIRRLLDKASGLAPITPDRPAPALEFEVERPHAMSAWLIEHPGRPAEYPELVALRRTYAGPYKATIEARLRVRQSEFTIGYELRADDPRLHLTIRGTWFERGTPETGIPVLNFTLPLAMQHVTAQYEIPFGSIDRSLNNREETPSQHWVQVTGKIGARTAGCLLMNDCKYGHSLDGNTLRLSLIRSSYDPDKLPEIGQHDIRLALRPLAAPLSVPDAIREGVALNRALRVVSTDVHAGPLPATAQFVHVAPGSVILCGMKQVEDEGALLLRMFNATGKAARATVTLHPTLLPAPAAACETDLMERPLAASTARVAGRKVTVTVPARGITSVRITLKPRAQQPHRPDHRSDARLESARTRRQSRP